MKIQTRLTQAILNYINDLCVTDITVHNQNAPDTEAPTSISNEEFAKNLASAVLEPYEAALRRADAAPAPGSVAEFNPREYDLRQAVEIIRHNTGKWLERLLLEELNKSRARISIDVLATDDSMRTEVSVGANFSSTSGVDPYDTMEEHIRQERWKKNQAALPGGK